MLSRSSYSRAISADIGEIQRRLRALEKHLERMGTRTSASAVQAADRVSDTVASALSSMADRFREFRESRSYDEVARLCFVWIIFLGAAVAVRRRLHFRMHLLVDRFKPGARRAIERVIVLAVIGFGAILVSGGLRIAPIAHRQLTDALEISQLWFFAAVPVGGALMIVFALPQLWRPDVPR